MASDIFSYLSATLSGQEPERAEWHFGEGLEVIPGPKPQEDSRKERAFIEMLKATRLRYIESLPTLDEFGPR